MRPILLLPLLATLPLLGCDAAGDWLRATPAATAYAAPLASDTTVVTTRRVWSTTGNLLRLATIMPNGAGLATTDWETGDPAVLDLASKELRRFRSNDGPYDTGMALYPIASPDGGQIVLNWMDFLEERESEESLRVVDVATGASRTLLAPDTTDLRWHPQPVAWTPAGDSVFTLMWPSRRAGDLKIVLIPSSGGTARSVHTIPRHASSGRVSLSPDGRWLLYDHELSRDQQIRSDIYIIDVQGGGARPLVEHAAVDQVVGWLPGTDVVLFSSDRSGTTDLWSVRVGNGRASAGPRLVRSDFFRSEPAGFGDDALFYRVETGSSGPAAIDMDPQSGALFGAPSPPLQELTPAFLYWTWSPDGQTLAARAPRRGGHTITLHSMETGERRVYWLDQGVNVWAIQWTADGNAIFMRASEGESRMTDPHHFLRLDLVTGTTRRLFTAAEPGAHTFHWRFIVTPDGRSIVVPRQRKLDDERTESQLVLRALDDGSERELYSTAGFIAEFSISPDGTQLAFMQQAGEESDSLFVMSMDGSQPLRAITSWDHSNWDDAVSLLGWLPAGNALLGARLTDDGTGEEILRIELDGSITVVGISPFTPQRGAKVPGGYRSRLVLSPAGNRLAHNVSDRGEELWRMDGLHELFAGDSSGRR